MVGNRKTVVVLFAIALSVLVGCGRKSTPAATSSSTIRPVTPLMRAVLESDVQRVRELIARGADVNQADPVDGLPLVVAIENGDQSTIDALLQAGASQDGVVAYFLASMDLAERANDPQRREVVEQLATSLGSKIYPYDVLPGLLTFSLPQDQVSGVLEEYQEELRDQQWLLFRMQSNYDSEKGEDLMGLFATSDPYVAIAQMGTNGINHDVSTSKIIGWLDALDNEQPFVLSDIGFDYLRGRFTTPIADPSKLAASIIRLCPDLAVEGTGGQKGLEQRLRDGNATLYLYWD